MGCNPSSKLRGKFVYRKALSILDSRPLERKAQQHTHGAGDDIRKILVAFPILMRGIRYCFGYLIVVAYKASDSRLRGRELAPDGLLLISIGMLTPSFLSLLFRSAISDD